MRLNEAFTALDQLNEDVFSADADGIKQLQKFVKDDDTIDELKIYDLDDVEDAYEMDACHIGDAVLDCCVCHSKVFKPVQDVVIDEEAQVANVGEECPYCCSVDGYKVVGEIQPFGITKEAEEIQLDIDDDADVLEALQPSFKAKAEKEEPEELKEEVLANIGNKLKKYQRWVDYDIKRYGKVSDTTQRIIDKEGLQLIKDQYGDYEVSAGEYKAESIGSDVDKYQRWIDYDMKRYGKISDKTNNLIKKAGLQVVKDQYGDYEVAAGSYKAECINESVDEIEIESDDLKVSISTTEGEEVKEEEDAIEIAEVEEPCEEETVVPVSAETEQEIVDVDIEDIDRQSIEESIGKCFKENFDKIKFFKLGSIFPKKDSFIVEGVIGFNSGLKKNTRFNFVPKKADAEKVMFENIDNLPCTLEGTAKDKKLFVESVVRKG